MEQLEHPIQRRKAVRGFVFGDDVLNWELGFMPPSDKIRRVAAHRGREMTRNSNVFSFHNALEGSLLEKYRHALKPEVSASEMIHIHGVSFLARFERGNALPLFRLQAE